MTETLTPLAEDFPAPDLEAWRAMAAKAAPDARIEALARRTLDGIEVRPLYGPWDGEEAAAPRRAPAEDASRPWDLRAPVLLTGSVAEANRQGLEHLKGGAASLLLAIDPNDPWAAPVRSADDLAAALDGVMLELAPVALDAGEAGVAAANWLAVAAKGSPQAKLGFHLDPVTVVAREGPDLLDAAVQTAMRHAPAYPLAELFLASGRFVHEAGGSEAQELAVMLASALAYARALEAAGMPADQALARITLGVAADNQMFLTLARTRAARMLWGRLAQVCGAGVPARIEARSSRRMLGREDVWTNLLRLTAAGFGAGAGGADAVVLDPFTLARGEATPLAMRQSRNVQLVLMEEANLGRVADPAGGSWFVERLTLDLARTAWGLFQEIEARGGAMASLGWLAERVEAAREARALGLAEGRAAMIGVTLHRHAEGEALPEEPAAAGRFAPVRLAAAFEGGAK